MNKKTLKERNQRGLALLLAVNAVAFVGLLKMNVLFSGAWTELWADLEEVATGAVLPFLVSILNGQLGADNKARLVFLRWRHPLPGSRAFSHFLHRDPRLNPAAVQRLVGDLPRDPVEQNRTWYAIYQTVRDVPVVADVHRHFLFARDYTSFAAMLFCMAAPLSFWLMPWRDAALYSVLLVSQYLLASQAGRTYGARLVTTVMAQAQSQPPH